MTPSAAPSRLAPTLTPEGVRRAYQDLVASLPSLRTESDWEGLWRRWNDLKVQIRGDSSRREFAEARDTNDKAAEEAFRQMREEIHPVAEEHDATIRQALLASPARAALETKFGPLLFKVFENAQASFAPENIALNVEVGELEARFERLLGNARPVVDGEELTLPKVNALLSHPDATKRKAAWEAYVGWIQTHADELHGLYSELVARRHQLGRNLGEPTFIPLGYRKHRRLDYGPAEVKTFREGIKRHIVPLLRDLRRKQAEWLGTPTVRPWDMAYYPGASLAPGVAPIGEQLSRAQGLFDRMHPKLGGHFKRMVAEGLIDLENRPGKRPGAYCTGFEDLGLISIFCNSTGDSEDIATLTHEMGHAFQGWESRWIEPLELRWPTYEACEIHSMGMEFMALRHLDAFFGPEDVQCFRRLKLIDTITILPYIAVVDAFQHWVYEHPTHTPEERDRAWSELWDEFLPGVDWSGHEAEKAVRWKRQIHLFVAPFYYIDYAIAESAALQLWLLAEKDPAKCMETYLELCRIGGSQSLVEIVKSAGLVSPFDPEVFGPAVAAIRAELGL